MAERVKHFSILSVILFIVGVLMMATFFAGGRASKPSPWLTVHSVDVLDTIVGDDPKVLVQRTIHNEFAGVWTVEISSDAGEFLCSNRGSAVYSPGDKLPKEVRLFGWWMYTPRKETPEEICGKAWPLQVGCYWLKTVWESTDPLTGKRRFEHSRDKFCVTEAKK